MRSANITNIFLRRSYVVILWLFPSLRKRNCLFCLFQMNIMEKRIRRAISIFKVKTNHLILKQFNILSDPVCYMNRNQNLLYKDESVCVCVCVCVCMSGGLPPDPHNLSPWNLAWAPHFTLARHRARGWPQMSAPRGTSHTDPIWNSLKGKELGGGQQTKVAPRDGFV